LADIVEDLAVDAVDVAVLAAGDALPRREASEYKSADGAADAADDEGREAGHDGSEKTEGDCEDEVDDLLVSLRIRVSSRQGRAALTTSP
jgi:hypothetical protein